MLRGSCALMQGYTMKLMQESAHERFTGSTQLQSYANLYFNLQSARAFEFDSIDGCDYSV